MNITIDLLKNAISKKGYKWFSDRPNLIGIRSTLDVPDSFNDIFCVVYKLPSMDSNLTLIEQQKFLNKFGFKGSDGKPLKEDGVNGKNTNFAIESYLKVKETEILKMYPNTTNPGVYWLNNPMSKLGTAILKPNQWVDCWQLGFHKKPDHRALVQTGGKITVYRDADLNKNYNLSESKVETGFFGINIHGAGKFKPTTVISKYSAGCQVFSNWQHKEEVMNICEFFKKHTGNKFTYTLIDEVDL